MLYKPQTSIQASDYYTSIRLLYRHKTIIQASDYHIEMGLLYKHQTVIQKWDYYTSIRRLYRHKNIVQASWNGLCVSCFFSGMHVFRCRHPHLMRLTGVYPPRERCELWRRGGYTPSPRMPPATAEGGVHPPRAENRIAAVARGV